MYYPINCKLMPRLLAALALTTLLAGCHDDDDDDDPLPGELRVVHASPDAPAVNVSVNGNTAIENLDYGESSDFQTLSAGNYDIAVEGIIPGGNQTVISVPDFQLPAGSSTSVVALGEVASIEPLVVAGSDASPAADEVAVVAVHAAPVAGAVDVFLTAPGADLAGANPALSFDFGESVDAGALPADTVEVQVTLGGNLVYNSGAVDLSAFAGEELLLMAVNSINDTEIGASPVKLLAVVNGTVVELLDADTGAGARVVHASPDAPTVEVFASSTALPSSPVELIDSISFNDVLPGTDMFVSVPPGDYVFDVAPDTDMLGDTVFTSGSLPLAAGSEYSVIASGLLMSSPAFELLVSEDENRPVATQASVQFIHGAPTAGTVDVYVTPAGDFTVDDVESGAAGDPLLDDFEFGTITDSLAVAPGDYDVRVVAGGLVAINAEGFALNGGDVLDVIARGPQLPSGSPSDFGVILLTP